MAGEFSGVMEAVNVRSQGHKVHGHIPFYKEWLKLQCLLETWQSCNGNKKYYTFHSSRCNSYSIVGFF